MKNKIQLRYLKERRKKWDMETYKRMKVIMPLEETPSKVLMELSFDPMIQDKTHLRRELSTFKSTL